MIEVRHLSKRYGTHLAVDDLSFSIDRGVVYGFLGPNGAEIKYKQNGGFGRRFSLKKIVRKFKILVDNIPQAVYNSYVITEGPQAG